MAAIEHPDAAIGIKAPIAAPGQYVRPRMRLSVKEIAEEPAQDSMYTAGANWSAHKWLISLRLSRFGVPGGIRVAAVNGAARTGDGTESSNPACSSNQSLQLLSFGAAGQGAASLHSGRPRLAGYIPDQFPPGMAMLVIPAPRTRPIACDAHRHSANLRIRSRTYCLGATSRPSS